MLTYGTVQQIVTHCSTSKCLILTINLAWKPKNNKSNNDNHNDDGSNNNNGDTNKKRLLPVPHQTNGPVRSHMPFNFRGVITNSLIILHQRHPQKHHQHRYEVGVVTYLQEPFLLHACAHRLPAPSLLGSFGTSTPAETRHIVLEHRAGKRKGKAL